MKKPLIIGAIAVIILVIIIFIGSRSAPPPKEKGTPVSETGATATKTPSAGQALSAPIPKANEGRVVFAITDAPANLDLIKSVLITISRIQVHYQEFQQEPKWVTVGTAEKTFDLLELKKSGSLGLIADVTLPQRNYTQIRLTISKVQVNLNDGTSHEAKLPSGDLRILNTLIVEKGKTSEAVFDFDVAKSLILTGSEKYIFAPVLKARTRKDVTITLLPGNKVRTLSGLSSVEYNLGMDENGTLKDNFAFDRLTELELIGNVIKVKPQAIDESGTQISPEKAIEIAKNNLQTVLSIRVVQFDSYTKIWRIMGMKNGTLTTVNINAETGAVLP